MAPKMNIKNSPHLQLASRKVFQSMKGTSPTLTNQIALEIILFATEGGVGCKKTAERIADEIEKSPDKTSTMLHIIKNELSMHSYFRPTFRIKDLINSLSQQ